MFKFAPTRGTINFSKDSDMATRQPVAAGRFYPGQAAGLREEIKKFLPLTSSKTPLWGVMLPHAGYVYCGDVIGKTLAAQALPSRLVVLCPNHTGRGVPLSVWPEGQWLTPLGPVDVDSELAAELISSGGGFAPDLRAHLGEHSIEVILPFLQTQNPDVSVVPVCVGVRDPEFLARAGRALAKILKGRDDVGLVVSSDMNHYENEKVTFAKDDLALERALAADPAGLLEVVAKNDISMCGAAPLALALYAARDIGGAKVEVVAHETSGKASGDFEHTVGYAGLRLRLA